MTEREYSHTEKRRTEGTAGRRYQHGGRQDRQWERQGGQTSRQFDQQTSHETGGQMGQQSSYGTSGQSSYGTGGQTSQQPSGQQTGGQTGGGRTGGRMGGGQTKYQTGQMGGQMSQGTGRMGGQTGRETGQMGRGTSQMDRGTGQMGSQSSQQRKSLIRPVTVSDVAATEVVTIQPDAPVSEVTQKMSREDVGSVVVTEGNRPIGIVTDRKVALALGETPDVSQLWVADLMSEDLFTVPEGTNVFDLVRRLSDKGVRRVPVVDDRGDLQGIVSLDDVVVLLAEEFYNVAEIIRKQSPRF